MPVSTPPTFSSVRNTFNSVGMGIANNLYAYRRGGGIVPNDSYYNAIGTGAPGDPVKLSQFAGIEPNTIIALSNHYADVNRTAYGSDFYNQSSALASLKVSTTGKIIMLGSTGWSNLVFANGSIVIDGNQYWNGTQAGSTSGNIFVQNWLVGGGPSAFSFRAVIDTGQSTIPDGYSTFRYGTYNTWQPITSDVDYTIAAYSGSANRTAFIQLVFTLQIARTTNLNNILSSSTITLTANAESVQTDNLQ